MVYFSDRSRKDDQTNSVIFDQCIFKCNKAHLGSAVDMIPNIYFKLSAGFVLAPKFINCQFLKNRVEVQTSQDGNQMTAGIGSIHASLFNINFHGYNHFENNWGTTIYVINGFIDFQNSSVSFKEEEL